MSATTASGWKLWPSSPDGPSSPAGPRARQIGAPFAVDVTRDAVVPSEPRTGRTGGDNIGVAFGGTARRHCQILIEHAELHQRVEQGHRFVMSDVLLRLGSGDIGDAQLRALFSHGYTVIAGLDPAIHSSGAPAC